MQENGTPAKAQNLDKDALCGASLSICAGGAYDRGRYRQNIRRCNSGEKQGCLLKHMERPKCLDYTYIGKDEQWLIKDDAPDWAKQEFKDFMKSVNPVPDENGVCYSNLIEASCN